MQIVDDNGNSFYIQKVQIPFFGYPENTEDQDSSEETKYVDIRGSIIKSELASYGSFTNIMLNFVLTDLDELITYQR